ncbi:serine/threonine-protein kinase [Streptomyces sp. NPDC018031]|uniref:serine/threonine-protein kinase n=1 Tax=Streptomyces sp. NPDC018031 TaxID=3365033 RepID=UPI0037A5EB98
MSDGLGRVLAGRYRLTGALGRGGMGAVWRAHDEHLGREVAVKELQLPERLTGAERANWVARLNREARAAARLKHPGIVTVHDRITDEDGRPWIVMELVHGRSLDDLIRSEGRLSPGRAAGIGRQVLAALRFAHQAGVTHRDIKPANILLEQDRVVLTDFGIAALDGDATLTATGILMGTPAFMAPEQVRGLPATAASDLWALGATLYAAVEGRPPFDATAPSAVLVAVATEEPAPARHAGGLGPALDGLLRKNPADRLTHDQLADLLAWCGDGRPAGAGGSGPAPSAPTAPAPAGTAPAAPTPAGTPGTAPTVTVRPAGPPGRDAALGSTPAGPPPTPTVLDPAPAPPGRARNRLITGIGAALLAGVAVTGYLLYEQHGGSADDATYQVNLRSAREMGAPVGFTRESEERTDGGRARLTYAAPTDDCDAGCRSQTGEVVQWLSQQPGVAAVRPPESGFDVGTCDGPGRCRLAITPYRKPPLANAQWYTEDGRLLFQVDLG